MLQVPETADAVDLLVQGTFLIRRALARSAAAQRLGAVPVDRPVCRDATLPIAPVTDSRSALGGSPNVRIA
jgi:hypothetical protein